MDIKEIQKNKEILESKIAIILFEFEKETGTNIYHSVYNKRKSSLMNICGQPEIAST